MFTMPKEYAIMVVQREKPDAKFTGKAAPMMGG